MVLTAGSDSVVHGKLYKELMGTHNVLAALMATLCMGVSAGMRLGGFSLPSLGWVF